MALLLLEDSIGAMSLPVDLANAGSALDTG